MTVEFLLDTMFILLIEALLKKMVLFHERNMKSTCANKTRNPPTAVVDILENSTT